ncbi:MAG: helix-turn-helix transcriptional regulator [Clostridia bacterium]|nr:helix-turn-helix transcriptional regulator [Clostridia bacterium]
MNAAEFGKRVAELRLAKGLTQTVLAKKLNVTTQAISKWERGLGFPDVLIIPQLACELETTTDYLFGCTDIKSYIG